MGERGTYGAVHRSFMIIVTGDPIVVWMACTIFFLAVVLVR
jgi:hypothetical protein